MCPDYIVRLLNGNEFRVSDASRVHYTDDFLILDDGAESAPLLMARRAEVAILQQITAARPSLRDETGDIAA